MERWINEKLLYNKRLFCIEEAIFMYLFRRANRTTWTYSLTVGKREELIKDLEVSSASFYRGMKNLKEMGILSENRGEILLTECLRLKERHNLPEIFRK